MQINIIPSSGQPEDKLADVELLFSDGPLEGLKLVGFAIWQSRTTVPVVTFPSRVFTIGGERRSYALLRPTSAAGGTDALRTLILQAFAEFTRESDGTGHLGPSA